MVSVPSAQLAKTVESIPYVTADEAYSLLTTQLNRLLALLDTLGPVDWETPTACTLWNVRQMVAHQAGGYASGTGYREMFRQYAGSIIPRRGLLPEDLVNQKQVGEREGKTPADLIAELRAVGPIAAQKWAYQFRAAKWVSIPHPVAGMFSLRHLMLVVHSRDTWMHRLDISRATGRPFEQTRELDGRIVELVVRDVAKALHKRLGGKAILVELTGPAGGAWKIGAGEPSAGVHMDALDFNIFVSGRYSFDVAMDLAAITGDKEWAKGLLRNLLIVF